MDSRPLDILATVVLFGLLLFGAGFVGILTLYEFNMAADACREGCHEEYVVPAFLIQWGGIAVGILTAVGGVIHGAVRKRTLLIWPLAGIAVVVAATLVAFAVAHYATGL
jgi:hypothetical protein